MRFRCEKQNLIDALSAVQKAAATKLNNITFTGVLFDVNDDNALILRGANYDMTVETCVPIECIETGKIVLGRNVFEIAKTLPDGMVNIGVQQDTATIICGSAVFKLFTEQADFFPKMPSINTNNKIKINTATLLGIINKTVFCCSKEEMRPLFTGALLDCSSDTIKVVATDAHRLAVCECAQFCECEDGQKVIIPAKALYEVARHLNNAKDIDTVTIQWDESHACFTCGQTKIAARLIAGQFPDWQRVIPTTFSTIATLDVKEFLGALDRVSLLTRNNEYNIINLSFNADTVSLSAKDSNVGQASDQVTTVNFSGDPIDIAFNARYLIEIMRAIEGEQIAFSLTTHISQAVIKPANDNTVTYVITPIVKT